MPQVRKLADAEVQALTSKGYNQRKLVEEQYDAILAEYVVGDWCEATIEPGENRLTVRNRLSAAANRRQLGLAFRRTGPEQLRFQVVPPSVPAVLQVPIVAMASAPDVRAESAPAPKRRGRAKAVAVALPTPEPAPAPKRRGGRPKKAV